MRIRTSNRGIMNESGRMGADSSLDVQRLLQSLRQAQNQRCLWGSDSQCPVTGPWGHAVNEQLFLVIQEQCCARCLSRLFLSGFQRLVTLCSGFLTADSILF